MSGSLPAALQAYATEAIKQQAYRRLAGDKLREFDGAWRESREAAKLAMDAAGLEAVAVPEQGVAVRRVRREVPGALTLRRVEEYTSRMVTAEESALLADLAGEVAREQSARAAKGEEKAEAAREAERKRAEREERAAQRAREKEERAVRAEAKRAEGEGRREAKRRREEAQARLEEVMEQAI